MCSTDRSSGELFLSTRILKIRISWKDGNFPTNFSKRILLLGTAVSGVFDKCRKACRLQVPNITTSRTSILAAVYCKNNLPNRKVRYDVWKHRPYQDMAQGCLGRATGMLLPEQQTGPRKQLFIAESNFVTDCVLICIGVTKVLSTAAFRSTI